VSSGEWERRWKRPMFVVTLVGLQAVVKLAEELVEQVPLGWVVPVSGGGAGVVVAPGEARSLVRVRALRVRYNRADPLRE
jgi:hypothetical protein